MVVLTELFCDTLTYCNHYVVLQGMSCDSHQLLLIMDCKIKARTSVIRQSERCYLMWGKLSDLEIKVDAHNYPKQCKCFD
jgi:hypothetical protein